MHRRHTLWVPIVLINALTGCEIFPSGPSSHGCARVESTTDTKTVAATDPATGATLATFLFAHRSSTWDGDLDCLVAHEYDRQHWVTLTIRNQTTSVISFDYRVSDPHYDYPGTVSRLPPGGTLEVVMCSLICPAFTSTSISVTTGAITYNP